MREIKLVFEKTEDYIDNEWSVYICKCSEKFLNEVKDLQKKWDIKIIL